MTFLTVELLLSFNLEFRYINNRVIRRRLEVFSVSPRFHNSTRPFKRRLLNFAVERTL
jgi:hypothetical protein